MLLPTTERLTEIARFDALAVAEAAVLMLDDQRGARIVAEIAGVCEAETQAALTQTGGRTKQAILVAPRASVALAQELLTAHEGQLARCFHALENTK